MVGSEGRREIVRALVAGLEFGADVFEEGEGELFGVGFLGYCYVCEGVVEDVAVASALNCQFFVVPVVATWTECCCRTRGGRGGRVGVATNCMVYLPLSMLARGSEEGVMCLMTCRICCLSSPTSLICESSTEATRTRPACVLAGLSPDSLTTWSYTYHLGE